jgi:hypothetical protein
MFDSPEFRKRSDRQECPTDLAPFALAEQPINVSEAHFYSEQIEGIIAYNLLTVRCSDRLCPR